MAIEDAEFPKSLAERRAEQLADQEKLVKPLAARNLGVLSTGPNAPLTHGTEDARRMRELPQARRGVREADLVRDPRTGNVLRADLYAKLAESRAQREGGDPIPPTAA